MPVREPPVMRIRNHGKGRGYVGAKFGYRRVFNKAIPAGPKTKELISWCKTFHKMGISPLYKGGSFGNLSFRQNTAMIITAASTALGNIKPEQVMLVSDYNQGRNKVTFGGKRKTPSSETPLHNMLYRLRPDINAVFHGHDAVVMKHAEALGLVVTSKKQAYGTPAFFKEVLNHSKKGKYVVWKGHGICSMGKSIKEAGENAVKIHELAEKLESKAIEIKEARARLRKMLE